MVLDSDSSKGNIARLTPILYNLGTQDHSLLRHFPLLPIYTAQFSRSGPRIPAVTTHSFRRSLLHVRCVHELGLAHLLEKCYTSYQQPPKRAENTLGFTPLHDCQIAPLANSHASPQARMPNRSLHISTYSSSTPTRGGKHQSRHPPAYVAHPTCTPRMARRVSKHRVSTPFRLETHAQTHPFT